MHENFNIFEKDLAKLGKYSFSCKKITWDEKPLEENLFENVPPFTEADLYVTNT